MPAITTTEDASLVTIDSANNSNNAAATKLLNQDSITINHDSVNIFKDNSVYLTISGNSATHLAVNSVNVVIPAKIGNSVICIEQGARLDLNGTGLNQNNANVFLKIAEDAEINFNGNSVNMMGEVTLNEIINHYDI